MILKTTARPKLWIWDPGDSSSSSDDGASGKRKDSQGVELEEGRGEVSMPGGHLACLRLGAHCACPSPLPVEVLKTVSAIIDAGSSINLYMFHGGTNFGFINGAMHFHDYKSDVTSYGKCPPRPTLPGTPPHRCARVFTESPSGTALAP